MNPSLSDECLYILNCFSMSHIIQVIKSYLEAAALFEGFF